MKKLCVRFGLVVVLMSLSAAAQAQTVNDVPYVWDSNGVHYAALSPRLDVKLYPLGVDDEYYGQLNVSMNYPYANLKTQIDELQKKSPGITFKRAILQGKGNLEVSIPLMGFKSQVMRAPSVDGPYFENTFFVNRAQFESMNQAKNQGKALIEIRGELLSHGKMLKLECSSNCRITE